METGTIYTHWFGVQKEVSPKIHIFKYPVCAWTVAIVLDEMIKGDQIKKKRGPSVEPRAHCTLETRKRKNN